MISWHYKVCDIVFTYLVKIIVFTYNDHDSYSKLKLYFDYIFLLF
jgi:hypothetical protein